MKLRGSPASPGVAIGKVFVYRQRPISVSDGFCGPDGSDSELKRLYSVMALATAELRSISAFLAPKYPDKAKIFRAHEDIIDDDILRQEVSRLIRSKNWAGDRAVKAAFDNFIATLKQAPNPATQEKAADFEDVCLRLLRIWHGIKDVSLYELPYPAIIAAHNLLPSDTALLDRSKVLAIITETGGVTSHSAIIARSMEIPAVLGMPNLLESAVHGGIAAVDALSGVVVLSPDPDETARYEFKIAQYKIGMERSRAFLKGEARTADGVLVEVGLNIASCTDDELAGAEFTDCVGLLRTEFLYMSSAEPPDEETQFCAYRKVLSRFGNRPVTLRTLDAGADKALACLPMPKEANPFLGNRGLRLCFSRPDAFRVQLRAALRASVFGKLWLTLPMVSGIDDIRRAVAFIRSVASELDSEGIPVSDSFKIGVMIETPSIAMISDLAAREVDFASIGTNDLCQYLTAADRLNPEVSAYYQPYHPALFRMAGIVAEQFGKAGKPVGVCGELAGDPLAAVVLVGLGLRKLSMNLSSVARVKRILSAVTVEEAENLANAVKGIATAAEVELYLKDRLSDKLEDETR